MINPKDVFASNIVTGSNPFAEIVTYTPSSGTPKEIYAVVRRNTSQQTSRGGMGGIVAYQTEIMIAKTDSDGMLSITPKKDKVTMAAPELNKTTHTYTVVGVVANSAMCWHIGLQM